MASYAGFRIEKSVLKSKKPLREIKDSFSENEFAGLIYPVFGNRDSSDFLIFECVGSNDPYFQENFVNPLTPVRDLDFLKYCGVHRTAQASMSIFGPNRGLTESHIGQIRKRRDGTKFIVKPEDVRESEDKMDVEYSYNIMWFNLNEPYERRMEIAKKIFTPKTGASLFVLRGGEGDLEDITNNLIDVHAIRVLYS